MAMSGGSPAAEKPGIAVVGAGYLNPAQRVSVYDRGVDLARPEELAADQRRAALVSYRTGDMVAPALTEREALAVAVEEFARAVRTGTPAATDGRAGPRVLRILEAASRSLTENGALVAVSSDALEGR